MKPTNLLIRTRALIALGMSAGMLINQPLSATGNHMALERSKKFDEKEKPVKPTLRNNRKFSSLNNYSVKIYPDILNKNMHVVAKKNEGKTIDFFVFDMQATMINHYKMKENDHVRITGLARGKYQYRVFSGDIETAQGYFEIR